MNGDELGAVGKGGFDLDIVDHLGDPFHDLRAGDDMGAGIHQIGDGAAVAGAFDDEIADQRDRLGIVEFEPRARAGGGRPSPPWR